MTDSRRTLGRVVGWLGIAIGVAVAVAGPLGYLLIVYSELGHELSLLAEIKATRLAKYVYLHQDLWQYQTLRLSELVEIPEAKELLTRQRLVDSAGKLVLETGDELASPIMRRSAVVVVSGSQVATIEASTSLRQILTRTGVVAAFSSLLGLGIYLAMRTLPMRIINQTLAELQAAEARYQLLFDANPLPMVVVHRNSLAFLAVNAAATEHYGWTREEILKMTIADLRPPGEKSPRGIIERAGNPTGRAATFSGQRHRTKDGKIIDVEIMSRAIEFNGKPAALSLAVDVTDRNSAEAQLRQSQKMEAVGQLTGGIAHDFNNILMVILANADELLEEEELDPAMAERLEQIGAAVLRASELTKQLLAFSRKQALSPKATNLTDLVSSTGKLLQRALGAQIEIEAVLADDLWMVNIDRAQLETALINLAVNARDAMPQGGKLLIETCNITWGERDSNRPAELSPGDYAMLAVTDSGTGMPPETLAKVFEPFFTTKEVGKGTGLGLSMVYGFIKQSNGHITIHSTVGRGTTFKLYLPRQDGTEDVAAPKNPTLPRGTERVLVVEDEPQVRTSVVQQLQSLGYIVSQAGDGAAGVAACETASQPFDLLLTDVLMPGTLNGRGLADEVARRYPTTRITFMSGYTDDAIVHGGVLDPGVLLLVKPFRKSELSHFIRRALDGPA